MKNITIAFAFIVTIILTGCHYGKDEAKKTLETNEIYKGDKKDYSTNRGNDYVRPFDNDKTAESKDSIVTKIDSTKK